MSNVGQKETQSAISTSPLPLAARRRTVLLDLDQFRARLAQFASDTGSKAELGRRLGVTGQFIDLLITGKRKPGRKLFKAMGARPVMMIEIEVGADGD